MFDFQITHESTECAARIGQLKTPHGDIQTPVFMPVGTKATVKSMDYKDLKSLDTEGGAKIILANTYHLAMRPGSKLVAEMGGLHKWMHWDRPILTDSGGFQVFSLGDSVKITNEGVRFQSHINGDHHFISPEDAMDIQHELGADIIMAFDECAPAGVDEVYARRAMTRTHRWLERCFQAKAKNDEKREDAGLAPQTLFPIVQGSCFKNLRETSAQFMADMAERHNIPGVAIGGVSVGEDFEQKFSAIDYAMAHLPKHKARYLMGIGTPDDLLHAVERGVDMFDCVLATRLARHNTFWDLDGRHDITNARYKKEDAPLCEWVEHYASREFSRSYIHHLHKENELLGIRLLSLHNIAFLFQLMKEIRYHVREGSFLAFKKDFLDRFQADK